MTMAPETKLVGTYSTAELVASILARPDAAKIVEAIFRRGCELNEHVVRFMCAPTACDRAEPLAFSMTTWVETCARIAEGLPAEALSGESLRTITPRISEVLGPTMHAVKLAHRACHFAAAVWGAAGGEMSAEQVVRSDGVRAADVTPGGGRKPH